MAAAVPVPQPGDFSPCSLPWPKCLSRFKLYHLRTVIDVCKGSVCCCTGLFLHYFNRAIALNRCLVHSKAPAGIMPTAGSGPSSLQALTLCPPTLYWGFVGVFFRSVIKLNSSFILALIGQIIWLLLFPVHVCSPSPVGVLQGTVLCLHCFTSA